MNKLPEDLSLPYIPTCTLVLRHAASVWYSQPTLLNFKENSAPGCLQELYLATSPRLTPNFTVEKINRKHLLNLTLPGYAKTSSDIYDLNLSRFRW